MFLCFSYMFMPRKFSGSWVWYGWDACFYVYHTCPCCKNFQALGYGTGGCGGCAFLYICDICSWWEDFQAVGCGSGEIGRMQGCVFLFLSYMFMLR